MARPSRVTHARGVLLSFPSARSVSSTTRAVTTTISSGSTARMFISGRTIGSIIDLLSSRAGHRLPCETIFTSAPRRDVFDSTWVIRCLTVASIRDKNGLG